VQLVPEPEPARGHGTHGGPHRRGRLILGIGAGWFQRDYDEYGYEFGTAGDRLRALDAAMPVIEERLSRLNPPPLRDPLPILIGGGGEKVTLRIVAEHAHIWNVLGDPDQAGRKIRILDEWCQKVGRDPKEIERSVNLGAHQVRNVESYVENGFTHHMIGVGGPDYELSPLKELISWRDEYRERHPETAAS
jgi:alkanesulfonate monooxygenase SsuD/methylene tetrahydromethanopterin reductase-like flavin-dependent oxidoreductase (luciferase family)